MIVDAVQSLPKRRNFKQQEIVFYLRKLRIVRMEQVSKEQVGENKGITWKLLRTSTKQHLIFLGNIMRKKKQRREGMLKASETDTIGNS